MGILFDSIETKSVSASDVAIATRTQVFVSEDDQVLCYTGVLMSKSNYVGLDVCPHYFEGKLSNDKIVQKESKGFFRIAFGCILLDNYIDVNLGNASVKKADCILDYPVGSSTYFGVSTKDSYGHYQNEDELLTRAVWGLTHSELTSILDGYARINGVSNPYIKFPRITRYQQHDNKCDLCNLWIPKQYPYVTFAESGHAFSHLSLWGCYRYFQLLLRNSVESAFAKALYAEGVERSTIEHLMKINDYDLRFRSFYAKIVTYDTIREVQ